MTESIPESPKTSDVPNQLMLFDGISASDGPPNPTTPAEDPLSGFDSVFVPVPSAVIPSRNGPRPAHIRYEAHLVDRNGLGELMTELAMGGTPVVHVFPTTEDGIPAYHVIAARHFLLQPKERLVQPAICVPKIVREDEP